jgi:hypothetical protein
MWEWWRLLRQGVQTRNERPSWEQLGRMDSLVPTVRLKPMGGLCLCHVRCWEVALLEWLFNSAWGIDQWCSWNLHLSYVPTQCSALTVKFIFILKVLGFFCFFHFCYWFCKGHSELSSKILWGIFFSLLFFEIKKKSSLWYCGLTEHLVKVHVLIYGWH